MNAKKLIALIEESGISKTHLAVRLGISRKTFWSKCTGKTEFSFSEIEKLVKELHIDDVNGIFFDN